MTSTDTPNKTFPIYATGTMTDGSPATFILESACGDNGFMGRVHPPTPGVICKSGYIAAKGLTFTGATPPTPATDAREAVARAICYADGTENCHCKGSCQDDGRPRVFYEYADAALSALAPIRAAEILAAEARGYAKAIEDAANEARQLWEYGIPSQEFPRRIRAIEHGAGK